MYTRKNGKYIFNKNGAIFAVSEISLLIMQNNTEFTLVAHGDAATFDELLDNKRSRNKHIIITTSTLDVHELNTMLSRGLVANKILSFMTEAFSAMSGESNMSDIKVKIIPPQEYEAEHRGMVDDFEELQIERDVMKVQD